MAAIDVEKLTVSYGNVRILDEVSFAIASGEFLAIVGPNGGGKTTLVRALLGLIPRESGEVRFGFNPTSNHAQAATKRAKIGYLPQRSSWADPLFPATVREVVASGLPGARHGRAAEEARKAIDNALVLLQIEDLASSRVGQLSGGQQQRTHLARALVGRPEVLVLDEPTGALDPSTRSCFFKTLEQIRKTRNTTIVIVTHDTHHLAGFAQKILHIDRAIVFFGSLNEYQRLEAGHYFGRGHEECAP